MTDGSLAGHLAVFLVAFLVSFVLIMAILRRDAMTGDRQPCICPQHACHRKRRRYRRYCSPCIDRCGPFGVACPACGHHVPSR